MSYFVVDCRLVQEVCVKGNTVNILIIDTFHLNGLKAYYQGFTAL